MSEWLLQGIIKELQRKAESLTFLLGNQENFYANCANSCIINLSSFSSQHLHLAVPKSARMRQ